MTQRDATPTSPHFTLERLADGVFAAVSVPGTGSMSNAGIVDLGGRTLIFDTFWTPQAAQDLRTTAERLTGRVATLVVNSHYNGDHIHGNQVFPEALILATEGTCELISTRGVELIEDIRETGADYLRDVEGKIAQERDEPKRRALINDLQTTRALVDRLPELKLRLPDMTFSERVDFRGSQRHAELLTYGGGHTASDAFLFLPDERVAFLGDLLFSRSHPSIWHDDYRSWIDILEQIVALEPRVVVPGHGPVGTLEDVVTLHDYLLELEAIATEAIERGASEEQLAQTLIPARYAGWDEPDLFYRTLRRIYRVLAGRRLDHD